MTQTHENAPSDRDHANVRFFPQLDYAAPMAAGLAMHLAFSERLREESYLGRKFGTTYISYKSTVRRWL